MDEYRDIGALNYHNAENIPVNTVRRGQVYQATHKGEQLLPYMRRSFISFTYGGRRIEDFDLIATLDNRLDRAGYADFDDITSDYDNLDGLYYWSTHYKTNSMEFTLSTDGIDLKKLDDFLHWFKAGISRELILAEHPNRGIMARVSSPPHLNLLPFEHDVQITVSSNTYNVKTTLYKGDISLNLVMDLPHWYAITNVLGKKIPAMDTHIDRFVDLWDDISTGEEVSVFESSDALKILYEDGLPLGSMIDANMLLGNGAWANVKNLVESCVWTPTLSLSGEDWTVIEVADFYAGEGARIDGIVSEEMFCLYTSGISTEETKMITTEDETPLKFDIDPESTLDLRDYEYGERLVGVIAGAVVDATNNGITSLSPRANEDNGPYGYFFYAGTAPAATIIRFTLHPSMSNDNYIIVPRNSHVTSGEYYNTFTIESTTKLELRFTTPNIFTSYNKVIELFRTKTGPNPLKLVDWETLRADIRDNVRHPKVRAWAIEVIDQISESYEINSNGIFSRLNDKMNDFIIPSTADAPLPVTLTFNSETGEAKGIFYYNLDDSFETPAEEDVGDMLKSNYIIILDRNYPNTDGKILSWTSTHPEYSHRIYHDVLGGLDNIQVLYKNMYL